MGTRTISQSSSAEGAGRKFFCIQKGGDAFCTHNLCMPQMLRISWSIRIRVTNMKKKIHPPSLPSPGRAPHVSLVPRHSGGIAMPTTGMY